MDFSSIWGSLLNIFSDVMWLISKIMIAVLIPFVVMFLYFFLRKIFKGERPPKLLGEKINRGNPLKKFLWDFPKQCIDDFFVRDPNNLNIYGVHLFCGEQGSGKSVAVVEFLLWLKKRFPFIKVRSNIDLKFQDGQINSWKDLVFCNNGEKGQVEFLDEIQNWFNSMDSKNFPPEMLQEITQQRKQRKIIVGTSQVFQRVSKPLREQCTMLYMPFTVAGCLTFVRVYKPKLDENGSVKQMRLMKLYSFVHTKEIREAYDTYQKVERLAKKGFLPRSEQIGNKELSTLSFPEK